MKTIFLWISILIMITLALGGCSPQEKNVTHSPRYHFASFEGTTWRAKVRLALADVKEYTGAWHLSLLAPWEFDSADPNYYPPTHCRIIRVLPVGTRIRIGRLMLDTGEGSQLWVTASLADGTQVYMNWGLLAENRWIGGTHPGVTHPPGSPTSRIWGVNPKYLESVGRPKELEKGGR